MNFLHFNITRKDTLMSRHLLVFTFLVIFALVSIPVAAREPGPTPAEDSQNQDAEEYSKTVGLDAVSSLLLTGLAVGCIATFIAQTDTPPRSLHVLMRLLLS